MLISCAKEKTKSSNNKDLIGTKTQKEYSLGNLKIQLNQIKNDGVNFYCESELITTKNGVKIDSIKFTPEPVGGEYGISNGVKINDHLIFTKHGDYDGRTLIINKKGEIFNIIGGENYIDTENQLLFTIYDSDLSGIAVFDLITDFSLLTIEDLENRPRSIHKKFEDRFYMTCVNDETDEESIWEFELALNKIMQVDLNIHEFNLENKLKYIPKTDVNCICEK
jgi:hypothetical protein